MDQNPKNTAKKLEGVFSGGYGVVPRSVMLQGGLSPEAKALYAYYCVVSGNSGGYQSSPREELILKTMHISHTRFIKHRKTLTEANLISFIQPKRETGKPLFETSRFLIVKSPRNSGPLPSPLEDAPLNALAAIQEGIFCEGFGLVPKMVLYDPYLSVEAKAAYVFLCVFANASTSGARSASPSSALLQEKLMTRKRVQHAFNELIDAGYIRRERLHNGAFAGMVYILNFEKTTPEQASLFDTAKDSAAEVENDTAETAPQGGKNDTAEDDRSAQTLSLFSCADTVQAAKGKNDTAKASPVQSRFETTVLEPPKSETTENATHINNSVPKNKINDKYKNIRHIDPRKRDGRTDEAYAHKKGFLEYKLEAEKQIDAAILSEQYGKEIMNAVVLVMADVYSADNGRLRINGRECDITQVAQVYKGLRSYHIEYVLERIAQQGEIANMQSYLYSCLYNSAISCDLEIFKLSRM